MSHTAHQCWTRSETSRRHVRFCKTQVLRSLFMTLFYLFLSAVPWIISASVCFAFSLRQSRFISLFPYFPSLSIWPRTDNAKWNRGAAPCLRGVHRLFPAQIAVYPFIFPSMPYYLWFHPWFTMAKHDLCCITRKRGKKKSCSSVSTPALSHQGLRFDFIADPSHNLISCLPDMQRLFFFTSSHPAE